MVDTVRIVRDLAILFIHLIVTFARLSGAGGLRSVEADSLLLKHQLWILNRSQERAPDLWSMDRVIAGLRASLMRTARPVRSAIVPETFHDSQIPSSTGEA